MKLTDNDTLEPYELGSGIISDDAVWLIVEENDLERVDVTVCVRVKVPVIVAVREPVTGVIDGVIVEVILLVGDMLFEGLTEAKRLSLVLTERLRVGDIVALNDFEGDFVKLIVVE